MNNIPHAIRLSCQAFRDHVALRGKRNGIWAEVTYGELEEKILGAAKGLIGLGVMQGENVALICASRMEWGLCDLAILFAGAVSVPIYSTSSEDSMEWILRHCEAKVVFVAGEDCVAKLKQIRERLTSIKHVIDIDGASFSIEDLMRAGSHINETTVFDRWQSLASDEVATIIYTSGTTGDPKGVMLSHRNILSNCEASVQCFPVGVGDKTLSFLPLSHALERMAGLYLMLLNGVTISYAEDLTTVPKNLLEVSPTIMTCVPRVLEKFYSRVYESIREKPKILQRLFAAALAHADQRSNSNRPNDFVGRIYDKLFFSKIRNRLGGRLRVMVSGGAALAPEIGRFFNLIGIPVLEGYGLTETAPVISVNRFNRNKIGTVGQAIPGVEIKLAPDGEICARGPNVMKGYFKNPVATGEVIDEEGWFHTGDIGEIDAEGFLKITDRKKELIVTSGGKKVAPQPMENELKLSQWISQACIVGEGHNYLTALIVPDFVALSTKFGTSDPRALATNPEVHKLYQNEIDAFNSRRGAYESIKKFTLLEREWTVEDNEITPTMKLKRKAIDARYQKVIGEMYS